MKFTADVFDKEAIQYKMAEDIGLPMNLKLKKV